MDLNNNKENEKKNLQGKRAKDGLDKSTVFSSTHLSPVVHLSQLVCVHSACTVCKFIPPSHTLPLPFSSFPLLAAHFVCFNFQVKCRAFTDTLTPKH